MPVVALAGIRTRAAEVVPMLAGLLQDADADVRGAAAYALGEYGEHAAPAVPQLMRAAEAGEVLDQMHAFRALGRIGPAARAAVPMLLRKFTAPRTAGDLLGQNMRLTVATSLGQIGPDAAPAVPALTAALEEDDAALWEAAALALARIGPAARPALPAIERTAARHPGEKSQLAVAFAKVQLGNAAEGWEALKAMALDNASTHAVFDTLRELGPASVPVLEAVVRSDSSNGWWAVQSLQKLPPDAAAKAVPALAQVLSAGRPKQRGPLQAKFDEAIVTLGRLGPAAREAAPVLRDLASKSPHARTREAAAAALARVEAAPATRPAATNP
jgi:HEAT repeat protein